jgi:AraC-like DNA-binding protein/predicted transcriptional regulator YdeE
MKYFEVKTDIPSYVIIRREDDLKILSDREIEEVKKWTKYIEEHITEELSTQSIAKTFNYSDSIVRRMFKDYHKMSLAEYIRKKKLHLAAEEVRKGVKIAEVAFKYSYKTSTGFARAFENEFHILPMAYRNAQFETINLEEYGKKSGEQLDIIYTEIKELKMVGVPILTGSNQDIDIAAQVQYWLENEFPCLKNTRFCGKKQIREDKISLWWHEPDIMPTDKDIMYLLGPVVKECTPIPKEAKMITIPEGKYAIFTTQRKSDRDKVSQTFQMFSECIFYGWLKKEENRKKVDFSRCTFHRYIDDKLHLYLPML